MSQWNEGTKYLKQIDWYEGRHEYVAMILLGNIGQLSCHFEPKLIDMFPWGWMSCLSPLFIVILLYIGIRYHRTNKEVFTHASARFVFKMCALFLFFPALGLTWLLRQ